MWSDIIRPHDRDLMTRTRRSRQDDRIWVIETGWPNIFLTTVEYTGALILQIQTQGRFALRPKPLMYDNTPDVIIAIITNASSSSSQGWTFLWRIIKGCMNLLKSGCIRLSSRWSGCSGSGEFFSNVQLGVCGNGRGGSIFDHMLTKSHAKYYMSLLVYNIIEFHIK